MRAVYDELKWPILNNNHKLNSTDSPFFWGFSQLCAVHLFREDLKLHLLADRFPAAQWVEQFNAKAISTRNTSLGNLSFFFSFWLLFQLTKFLAICVCFFQFYFRVNGMLSLHPKPSVTTTNISRWTLSCHTSGFDPGSR